MLIVAPALPFSLALNRGYGGTKLRQLQGVAHLVCPFPPPLTSSYGSSVHRVHKGRRTLTRTQAATKNYMFLEPCFVTDRNGRSLTVDPHPAQKRDHFSAPVFNPSNKTTARKPKCGAAFDPKKGHASEPQKFEMWPPAVPGRALLVTSCLSTVDTWGLPERTKYPARLRQRSSDELVTNWV